MVVHKRTEITVETEQLLIIRRWRVLRAWCPECGCEVDMVRQGETEELAGMSGHALRDRAQANRWHLSESQDGAEVICLESLLKSL